MQRKVKEITHDLCALQGDPLLPDCEPAEGLLPSIEDYVRLAAPGKLRELILSSPKENLSGWKSLKDCQLSVDSLGVGTLILPDDFLLLGNLRLSGWKNEVTGIVAENDPVRELIGSVWQGIRGSSARPMAFLSFRGTDRALTLSYCEEGAVIEEGCYLPEPAITAEDTLAIPDRLYLSLLRILRPD